MAVLNNENIEFLKMEHLTLKGLVGCVHIEIHALSKKFFMIIVVCHWNSWKEEN